MHNMTEIDAQYDDCWYCVKVIYVGLETVIFAVLGIIDCQPYLLFQYEDVLIAHLTTSLITVCAEKLLLRELN